DLYCKGADNMVGSKNRFRILIALVAISGFSQGMLLPLLAIILEKNGVSSSVNGLHATGLYIGVLIASPFMEKPMKKFGFKPMIVIGGMLVFISMALFPFWEALWFWFVLRVAIGIGDNMLHFGTQTWITTTVSKETRGKSIAYYGVSFGLGFSIGPLMTRLLTIHEAAPFLLSALLSMLVWATMFFVRNSWPEESMDVSTQTSSVKRLLTTGRIAWVALLPGFGYGFLEATLHGIFPVYGLRIGHDVDILSLIFPCFALFVTFTLAGIFVCSLYSLGISYMTDLLPTPLLPAGNLLVAITFSIGSISGPFIGGMFIEMFPGVSFFYIIVCILTIIFIATFLQNRHPKKMAS